MPGTEVALLVMILMLLLLVAILSFSESALASVNRARVKALAQEGSVPAKMVDSLLEDRGRALSAIRIWNEILILLVGAVATYWAVRHLSTRLEISIAIFVLIIVCLIFGEIIPKRIASQKAESAAFALVRTVRLLSRVTLPIINAFTSLTNPVVKLFGVEKETKSLVTEEEIKMMVETAKEQGILEEREKDMIHSVFEMGETIAKEVMVPRPDMICVEINTPLPKVLDVATTQGFSRLPAYEGSIDNIVGIINTKDLLALFKEKKTDIPLHNIIRPAHFIPGSKKIDELLREMQKEKINLAIVVDEYGGTDGLVTMEDLIEEIVGEIADEYDKETQPVMKLPDGSYIVDAKMILEDANESLGISIPTDEFETVGGFVYGLLGRIPTEGESTETEDLILSAEKVVRQRITKVRIRKKEKTDVAEEENRKG